MKKDATEPKKVPARLLLDCALGKADDVVMLTDAEVAAYVGKVDTDKHAVAYAKALKNG